MFFILLMSVKNGMMKNDAVYAPLHNGHITITKQSKNTAFILLPTMNYETDQQNRAWVGTFQLVWNDFVDYIIKQPVKFVEDPNNTMAKELNKKKFKENMISSNSYYKTYGLVSPGLKQDIEAAIMKK